MDDAVAVARWQFGITTVYHFLFVPITIATSMLVAIMQTMWRRTGNDKWLKLTKFYGKLFLINFAAGVVTGIVQEFQFGMNWSEYSRFVGDVFGAPLALEALLAFFLESTFIGLWIFGWGRLNPKIHLASIYLAAIGTMVSAVFILAANSWMQNPVGAVYRNGRAEMADFGAVLTNPVFLATFPHQIAACYMTSGGLIAGIAGWHLWRANKAKRTEGADDEVAEAATREANTWRTGVRFGAITLLIASLGILISGDLLGKQMVAAQPMKMAAAEALWKTEAPADFSLFTVGTLDGKEEVWSVKVPGLTSFLSHSNFTDRVQGINDLEAAYASQGFTRDDGTTLALQKQYAEELKKFNVDSVAPIIPVSYWTFRIMMGLGFLGMAASAVMLWVTRKNKPAPQGRWFPVMCAVLPFLPLFGNSFGWIFTEMGRQPWLVAGVLPTSAGISPGVGAGAVWFSMIAYTLVYAVIAVIVLFLFMKYIRLGLPDVSDHSDEPDEADAPLSFAY